MATLILKRTSQFANYFREYKILVKDKLVTKLSNGEQYQMNLDEGTYQIQAKIDWLSSETIEVSLKENEIKTLEIGCSVLQDKQSILLTILPLLILIGSILIYDKITLVAWGLVLGLFIVSDFILTKGKSLFYFFGVGRSKYLYIKEL